MTIKSKILHMSFILPGFASSVDENQEEKTLRSRDKNGEEAAGLIMSCFSLGQCKGSNLILQLHKL